MGLLDGLLGNTSGGYVPQFSPYINPKSFAPKHDLWKTTNRVSISPRESLDKITFDGIVRVEEDIVDSTTSRLRDQVSVQMSNQFNARMLEELTKQLEEAVKPKEKTPEEKVIDIVKGGFENKFGMSIQEFQEIYDGLVENSPEKLI